MRTLLLLCAVVALAWGTAAPPITSNGKTFQGIVADNTNKYLGIYYGKSTALANRWKRPVPETSARQAAADGSAFAPSCPQTPNTVQACAPCPLFYTGAPGSTSAGDEDCLALNVYRPVGNAPSTGWPVMVYIHGGAYYMGQGSGYLLLTYDGRTFAQQGVIVVTVNYRHGWLGTMAADALNAEDTYAVGAYAHLDQQAALQWVQDNIGAFGGSKFRVTLAGESAGGSSVANHMISTSSRSLFAKTILQHHVVYAETQPLSSTLVDGNAQFAVQASANNCTGTNAQILACLRTKPIGTLNVVKGGHIPAITYHTGGVLQSNPYTAIANGQLHTGPMLCGDNAAEGTVFVGAVLGTNVSVAAYQAWQSYVFPVELSWPTTQSTAVEALYPCTVDGTCFGPAQAEYGDVLFKCPTTYLLDAKAAMGDSNVYSYRFDKSPDWLPTFGPTHTLELPYVWSNFDNTWLAGPLAANLPGACTCAGCTGINTPGGVCSSADDRALGVLMNQAWANFVKTSVPSATGAPTWPKYTPGTKLRMAIVNGTASSWFTQSLPDGNNCAGVMATNWQQVYSVGV